MPDQDEALREFAARLEASKVLLSELEKRLLTRSRNTFFWNLRGLN
jgi:hypothetical protein